MGLQKAFQENDAEQNKVVHCFPLQKAGVVLMTNDFVSDGREGKLLKLVLLLIKRGSHLFEKNKKQFAAYFQACKSSFIDHHPSMLQL